MIGGDGMKKTAVLTYCEWNSYGSILQAYGLKTALAELGCGETIYKTFRMESPLHKRVKKDIKSMLRFARSLSVIKKLQRAYLNNTAFIEEQFSIVYYDGYEELKKTIPENDCYLAGSDQVWNPSAPQKEFFLDFNTYGKKRLSYAASFGVLSIGREHEDYIRRMLSSFSSISVREKSMVPVIRSLDPSLTPEVHIDPTFLVSDGDWRRSVSARADVPERYILVYVLYRDNNLNDALARLSKRTGLPVISVQLGSSPVYADKRLYDCDVREFLWLIDRAEYVVTSSFHGLAFSIIFHKRFSAVVNPSAPTRLTDLMELLSIENCSVDHIDTDFCVDYEAVDRKIKEEKDRSYAYLRRALSE